MPLNELLPAVSQLSHQDKLRLIHFLLLAVAKEEGCTLEPLDNTESENLLLAQLASTEAVVWSPYEADEAAQTLSELLTQAKHRRRNFITVQKSEHPANMHQDQKLRSQSALSST